jgi:uncharacterized protein (DUF1015 family)
MVKIKPFKAIRPAKDKVHLVASRSYVSYSPKSLENKLNTNPYSFIHIINPEFGQKEKSKPNSTERFLKTKKKFQSFLENKVFIAENTPAIYLYRQSKENGLSFTGIICAVSIDDYLEGKIKIHEQTLTKREQIFKDYLKVCDFNAEPVLLTYPDNSALTKTIAEITEATNPEYDFTTTDTIRHTLWNVTEQDKIEYITNCFSGISSVYIADGHHRSASSSLLGQERRLEKNNYKGNEAFNYFLVYLLPESQVKISSYNRLVKDANNISTELLLQKIAENFSVEKINAQLCEPKEKHSFSMYIDGNWYLLGLKDANAMTNNNPVTQLDSYILSEKILSPILGIKDLKNDKRIYFIDGVAGAMELKRNIDTGKAAIAFGLFPSDIKEVKQIADSGMSMPPKSTWIEPKLRSGLIIYSIEGDI